MQNHKYFNTMRNVFKCIIFFNRMQKISSTILPKAEYFHPELINCYPIKIPVVDQHIKNSVIKWREMVSDQKLCPFIYSFGAKYNIEVERSNDPQMWLRHAFALVQNTDLNSTLIVLPMLKMPLPDYARHVIKTCRPDTQLIHSGLFGPPLNMFQAYMISYSIRAIKDSEATEKHKVLIDIPFHPYSTHDWSPWPIIQLVKYNVMIDAKEWYKKKYDVSSAEQMIISNNRISYQEMLRDPEKKAKLKADRWNCYLHAK